jgi:hypothetical protein
MAYASTRADFGRHVRLRVGAALGRASKIRPGDVVWFPPGEKHWHGATPTTAMTHIAIQEALNGKLGITMGPDGLWFTEYQGSKIGRLVQQTEQDMITYSLIMYISSSAPILVGTFASLDNCKKAASEAALVVVANPPSKSYSYQINFVCVQANDSGSNPPN